MPNYEWLQILTVCVVFVLQKLKRQKEIGEVQTHSSSL